MMEEYAKEYGRALYDLAVEEGVEEAMLQQLEVVAKSFSENPNYKTLLCAPKLPKEERVQLIEQVFGGKVHPYLLHFLKILTEKRRIGLIPKCYETYAAIYYERHGIMTVTAVTAVPLGQSAKERLVAKLEMQTGKQILLKNVIDSACIGGMKLIYDGKLTDASVKAWMEQLQDSLMKLDCKL